MPLIKVACLYECSGCLYKFQITLERSGAPGAGRSVGLPYPGGWVHERGSDICGKCVTAVQVARSAALAARRTEEGYDD